MLACHQVMQMWYKISQYSLCHFVTDNLNWIVFRIMFKFEQNLACLLHYNIVDSGLEIIVTTLSFVILDIGEHYYMTESDGRWTFVNNSHSNASRDFTKKAAPNSTR